MPNNSIILHNVSSDELYSKFREIVSEEINKRLHPEVHQLEYKTKNEVKTILRCSLRKVSRMTSDGTLKGYRFGRNILYKSDEINEVLKEIQVLKYKRS